MEHGNEAQGHSIVADKEQGKEYSLLLVDIEIHVVWY